MYETEIHRVYTEQTKPVIDNQAHSFIACQDVNEFSDEFVDELILTTDENNVTCKLCLEASG